MAYRRTSRARSGYSRSRAPARRSSSARRSRGSRRAAAPPGVLRIVIENSNASAVSRPELLPLVRKPTNGKARH